MAVMALTAALVVPMAARQQAPFKGAMQGQDTDHTPGPVPGTVVVTTSSTGIGTDLGLFSFIQEATVNLEAATETGSAHWIAENQDSIDTILAGSAEPTDTPGVIRITEIHTIVGGTGRFARARGSVTVNRLHHGATFLTFGSIHGTITTPGAAH
jgi:hypothetical protein